MKKLILFVGILFVAHVSYGQIFSWGIKAGVNSSKISFDDFSIDGNINVKPEYQPGGDNHGNLTMTLPDGTVIINPEAISIPTVAFEPSSYEVGYHFGAFARIKIAMLFLQPELIFSQTNASINLSPDGFDLTETANEVKSTTSTIKYNNFDIPVLVGIKLGPAHFCIGPVATFKLSSSIDDETAKLLETLEREEDISVFTATKNATFGAQVGAGLTIAKKVTIDVRYEFGLSKLGDSVTIGDQSFKTDQRQNQFIASIGWMF